MCRSMVDIRSTAAEIRRGKKRRKKKERNYRAKIYMVSLLHRATINMDDSFGDKHSYEQISEFDKYEVRKSECIKICIKFDNRGITWCILQYTQ